MLPSFGAEVKREVAEALDSSGRQGDGGGRSGSRRRAQAREGRARETDRGKGRARGESEGGRGGAWRLQEPLQRRRKQEVAMGCGRRRRAHAIVLLVEEEDDRGRLLGWPASWAGFSPGLGKLGEVFPFCFFFLFFCHLF